MLIIKKEDIKGTIKINKPKIKKDEKSPQLQESNPKMSSTKDYIYFLKKKNANKVFLKFNDYVNKI